MNASGKNAEDGSDKRDTGGAKNFWIYSTKLVKNMNHDKISHRSKMINSTTKTLQTLEKLTMILKPNMVEALDSCQAYTAAARLRYIQPSELGWRTVWLLTRSMSSCSLSRAELPLPSDSSIVGSPSHPQPFPPSRAGCWRTYAEVNRTVHPFMQLVHASHSHPGGLAFNNCTCSCARSPIRMCVTDGPCANHLPLDCILPMLQWCWFDILLFQPSVSDHEVTRQKGEIPKCLIKNYQFTCLIVSDKSSCLNSGRT